jgi:ornithine carbamoyltransferase
MNHFLCLSDIGSDGLPGLLDWADRFKETRGSGATKPLQGKSVALVFEKASTRTRISLEVAVNELGGSPLVISSAGSQIGRGEPIEDTARVLSRMVHAITLRTFSERTLTDLAKACSVPVLNALTDTGHPMQLLADLQTVRREFHTLSGLKYAWVGDGNNMANSWIEAAGLLGLELTLACPEGFTPRAALVDAACARGGQVRVVTDPKEACSGAHVINTDVFASMGQEAEANARLEAFRGMCVDESLVGLSDPRSIVLHCLPAHRGEEISHGVIEGPQSRVFDQAEARLHTSKAVLCWALGLEP